MKGWIVLMMIFISCIGNGIDVIGFQQDHEGETGSSEAYQKVTL